MKKSKAPLRVCRGRAWLGFVLCLTPLALGAQTEEVAPPGPSGEAEVQRVRTERSLTTLSALERSRDLKQAALRQARAQLAVSEGDPQRSEVLDQIRKLEQDIDKLNYDFESVATGIDVRAFDLGPSEEFDLRSELQKLVQPIIEELKDATEAPRQIEHLRGQVAHFTSRERIARDALKNIQALLGDLPEGDPQMLASGLERARKMWEGRLSDIESQRTLAQFQLDKRLSQRTSIIDSTQSTLANFFRTRGLNLLLAFGTFFGVLLGMRAGYRMVSRSLRGKTQDGRPFYARLIDVLYYGFVGVFALATSLLVLYATSDWVLLGVTLLFLLGVAWAGKTAIPLFLEQIRLLLNLGTVRERERVLIDGIPYNVSKLSFYTLVANPELAGGVRRLPIRDLIDMRSRTTSRDELWFPCRREEWVLLSDGVRGLVKHQSPDAVQLEMLGGTRVTYPTTVFLRLAPQNLSAGFRLSVRFGVDYRHQAIATTEVPRILLARVRAGLEQQFGAPSLQAMKVEFLEAGSSSLDYAVIVDAAGAAARDYDAMKRAIQRLCVETCNEKGWVIPFTQVTLHQAAGGATPTVRAPE